MRSVHVIAVIAVMAMLLAGCGGDGDGAETAEGEGARSGGKVQSLQPFEITLDGGPSPENVGVLVAEGHGYFEDVGLQVSVYPPEKPRRPIPYLLRRWADVSISSQPEVMLAQDRGAPIVIVGTLISEPTAALIWLRKSDIDDVADLRGKTIAIPGLSFQRNLLREALARAGLTLSDVRVESVGYELVPALASGRADAIFGGSWNVEGEELEARGLEPVIVRVQSLGIRPYDELVLIARRDRLIRDPDSIRDFMSAVERGTAVAIENPEAATKAILDSYLEANPKATRAGVEATLPLLSMTSSSG